MTAISLIGSVLSANSTIADKVSTPAAVQQQASSGVSPSVIVDISNGAANAQAPTQIPSQSEVTNLMAIFGTNLFAFAAYDPSIYSHALALKDENTSSAAKETDTTSVELAKS